jgi:hypothetical protein
MGLRNILERESSNDITKEVNARWETNEDGRNVYLSDQEIKVPAAKRCLGLRSGRGYYGGNNQCSSKATVKNKGMLCKKCFNEATDLWQQVKRSIATSIGQLGLGEDAVSASWTGLLYDNWDDEVLRKKIQMKTPSIDKVTKFFDEHLSDLLVESGIVNPDEDNISYRRARTQHITKVENDLMALYNTHRSTASIGLAGRIYKIQANLDLFAHGKVVNMDSSRSHSTWYSVPWGIETVQYTEDGWVIEMTDNARTPDTKHFTEALDTIRDGLHGDWCRVTVDDLEATLVLLKLCKNRQDKRDTQLTADNKLISAANAVHTSRPFEWESSKPSLFGDE